MKVKVYFISAVLLFIIMWICYVPSSQEENVWVNTEALHVHNLIQNNHKEFDDSTSSGEILSGYREIVLDHEFPDCRQRNIYNGNANYSLPDILNLIRKFIPPPTGFVQQLKNPCWYGNYDKVKSKVNWNITYGKQAKRFTKLYASLLPTSGESNKLYCLPYMYLLGYPKCGTTSLYKYFRNHPEIATLSLRGYGWLGLHSSGLVHKYPFDIQSLLQLLERFYPASQQIEASSILERMDNMIFADFSPATSWRQEGFEQSGGSMCDPPLLLREMQPDAKFVVLMREPINRLYSAFWFYPNDASKEEMKFRNAPKTFTEDVHIYFDRLKRCDKHKSMLECLREAQDFHHHFERDEQLLTGFYYLYLLPWLQVFPRKSFLFIRTEDMKEDTAGILQEVFQFLGMPPIPEKQLRSIVNSDFNSQAMLHSNNSDWLLPPLIKEQLRSYYRPFNEKLAQLLDDDSFLWEDIN